MNSGKASVQSPQSTSIKILKYWEACARARYGASEQSETSSISSLGSLNLDKQPKEKAACNGSAHLRSSSSQPELKKITSRKRKAYSTRGRLLACPYKKDSEIHGQIPVCLFEGTSSMSGVTQHLNTWAHSHTLPFLKLCRNCWNYVLVPSLYQRFHMADQCDRRAQPKGSLVASQWFNLHRLLFPFSERVPSPCKLLS